MIAAAVILALALLTAKSAAQTKADENPTINNQPAETTHPPVVAKPSTPGPLKSINLKSDHHPDPATLQAYLETLSSKYRVGSPLAPYAAQIAKSDFWALLIGICYIEQYQCTQTTATWNYWGMGPGLRFKSAEEGIDYMDNYFINLYPRKSTIQSLKGYYCASACTTWEPTVIRIKQMLESSM